MGRKAGVWIGLVWGLVFCALAVAGGLGAGYFVDMGMAPGSSDSGIELNPKLSFIGPLKPDQLDFTRSEIVALNNCVWNARDTLATMDVQVGSDSWDGDMAPDDMLEYSFEFGTTDGLVIKTWPCEVPRRHLVRELERKMGTAADECRRCRDRHMTFRTLYI
ncbi:hypothetical protein [Salidesulfovibrio onnuriiensis]|uniref:hypothetical protein n=1 Tax=Salidesulfovibrio onnuriiensis TaxID=2583823 RepID=UPI0011C9A6B5|nr:hypothetical protein [Salidesulfovibrio onnuriiensis]